MARELLFLLLVCALQWTAEGDECDFVFTNDPVPYEFYEGDQYPSRDEYTECQPIRLRVSPGTRRYHDLVSYYSDNVYFSGYRRMTSRMHTKLAKLAARYYELYGEVLHVLKAWTDYPDYDVNSTSLHYEGRGIRIEVSSSNGSRLLKLAIEYAGFDWIKWYSGYAYLCVIPDACDVTVDLAFILDQSGSVGRTNNDIALNFISDVVDFFEVAPNETQISFVTYSSSARVHFDLNDFHSKSEIQSRILNAGYPGGYTLTALGLFQAGVILNPVNLRGARPLDEGIPRIAVLITDGRSNVLPIETVANDLRGSGVQVYTVGIANIFLPELKFIASDPDCLHVFLLDSFNDAEKFVDFLSYTACEAPAIVEPGTNTTTDVDEDSFRFFQTECTAFSVEIMIEQIDLEGRCSLYASTSKPNPGPLDSHDVVYRNEDHTSDRRSLHLFIKKKLKFLIYVSVRGLWSRNRFAIVIWDRLFTQDEFKAFALANTTNGSIFDLDRELTVFNATFSYTIAEGPTDKFAIDPATGILTVLQPLNVGDRFKLLVVAQNNNASCHRGRVKIEVCVVEQNFTFPTPPPAFVCENATVGDVVSDEVVAMGGTGSPQYSIVGGNGSDIFAIDEDTGLVTVAMATLDFETDSSYLLVLEATQNPSDISATANLIINVIDKNEPPVFVTPCAAVGDCVFSIDENLNNTLVDTILVTDPDTSAPFNELIYSIIPSPIGATPFVIDNMGQIFTSSPLDREFQDVYMFVVTVTNDGFSLSTNVTVDVNDVNDNPPMFGIGASLINIPETRPVGIIVEVYGASDLDIGINAVIIFNITNISVPLADFPFEIDSTNGRVTLIAPLDADVPGAMEYRFDVVISNPDGLSSTRGVTATVRPVNDNVPQFVQFPYMESVAENSPLGTLVVVIETTDADLPVMANMVEYSIIGGNMAGVFVINATTGAITVAGAIDREVVPMYTLMVEAFDGSFVNVTDVIITVSDENDNAPMFSSRRYTFSIPEDQTVFITTIISAIDDDDPGTPNGQVTYTILNNTDVFMINSTTGEFSLISTLDFETEPFYNITVVATDGGSLSDTATIEITVLNINEHAPVTSGDATVDVLEIESSGFEVVQVNATDLDGMSVTFSLSSPLFNINTTSGLVTLMSSLDFETQDTHTLQVVASDGMLASTAFITVNVIDFNEFDPTLDPIPPLSIVEEQPIGTVVATVTASDQDGSDVISFSLQASPISSRFTIDSNGVIMTAQVLDRESLLQEGLFINPEPLTVVVTDNGQIPGPRMASFSTTITLEDINDNAPSFLLDPYQATVEEESADGVVVETVEAVDGDAGANGTVEYILVDEALLPFTIGTVSGTISVNGRVDRETLAGYNLTVIARDMGSPPQLTNVTVVVMVTDINDNDPIFAQPSYNTDIPESTPPDSVILTVTATDSDEGVNADIIYSIQDQIVCSTNPFTPPPQCFFNINDTNGEIQLVMPLDFETRPSLQFNVTARDQGSPVLSDTAPVTITVINVDEVPPTFDAACDATVSEDVRPPVVITTCSATDTDFTSSDVVTYTLTQGDTNLFSIDGSGAITLLQPIDRETQDTYDLVVRVTDAAGLFTEMNVTITVGDVNDNAPIFQNAPYSLTLTDEALEESRRDELGAITVLAIDADIGANGEISYSIVDVVQTDADTVVIITATDGGAVPQSANTTATIVFQSPCREQDYSIDSVTGVITMTLLCSINISAASTDVVLHSQILLSCSVVRVTNDDVTVVLLRESSVVDSAQLMPGSQEVMFLDDNATLEDQGRYDCRASIDIGTIQTATGVDINIIIPPTIVLMPQGVSIDEGGGALLVLQCMAEGSAPLTYSWMTPLGDAAVDNNIGINLVGGVSILVIPSVFIDSSYDGDFTCTATNAGGADSATARVNIFSLPDNAVVITVADVSDPDPPNNCNNFDSDTFDMTLSGIMGMPVHTTGVEGEGVCPPGPCSPNPCVNGGICTANSDSTFTCECVGGYTGNMCEEDINECTGDSEACSNGGTCVNLPGSHECMCVDNYFGSLCQYNPDLCLCPPEHICESEEGVSHCVQDPDAGTNNLVIQNPSQSEVTMNQIINTINEDLPTSSGKRRKRDSMSLSGCVGEFMSRGPDDPNSYYLGWLCPAGVQTPSWQDLASICNELVRLQLVTRCSTPEGFAVALNEVAPSDIQVQIIALDTDDVLSYQELLALLEATGAIDKLIQEGYNVTGAAAVGPTSEPIKSDSSSSLIGGVIGGSLGVLVLVILISTIIIILLVNRRRQKRIQVPTSDDIVMSDVQEPRYAKVNPKSLVLTNTDTVANSPYGLFDDVYTPIKSTPPITTPTKKDNSIKRVVHRKLEKTDSSENLLDNPDYEISGSVSSITSQDVAIDEPIYGNMNFKWEGNTAGERWENYWKTQTVVRGSILNK